MPWACDLWPQDAPSNPCCTASAAVALDAVFPSARRAIVQSLSDAGHTATSTIGYPAFVSDCVPRAIRKVATAVRVAHPEHKTLTQLDGLLVHEQWGWPLRTDALPRLLARFSRRPIVLDRVDSADFFLRSVDSTDIVEIASLSKTLGLLGGGLARIASGYVPFNAAALTASTREALDRLASRSASGPVS